MLLPLFIIIRSESQQYTPLDLTIKEQQQDFLKFLSSLSSLLQDTTIEKTMNKVRRHDSSNVNLVQTLLYQMMKDSVYMKKLSDFFAFGNILEKKYGVSKFSDEQWNEIAHFGTKNGIYFIPALKKYKEQTKAAGQFPFIFPLLPQKSEKDNF